MFVYHTVILLLLFIVPIIIYMYIATGDKHTEESDSAGERRD